MTEQPTLDACLAPAYTPRPRLAYTQEGAQHLLSDAGEAAYCGRPGPWPLVVPLSPHEVVRRTDTCPGCLAGWEGARDAAR